MSKTRDAVLMQRVRPPEVLWFAFAVLVFVGLGTTLGAVVYLTIVTLALVAGDASLQWEAFPFGISLLALGIGALLGARALWRQRRRARMVALVVLPLIIAVGAVGRLVVNDDGGLQLNLFVALSLLFPLLAWAIFFLPSVRSYYERLLG
ncbi:hypothetical protein [Aquipuribacter sp. SD81]|uniref:hypothetical protein n=1 Tax=Aquipuribacter sp. SD81 TaxID=3127703 RepID=UPI003016C6EE